MWQDKANCNTAPDPNIFFSARKRDKAQALAYCNGCSVVGKCLAFAIAMQCDDGIYGGMTAEQRKELARV